MTSVLDVFSVEVKNFVDNLLVETKEILKGSFVGFYIHGSLAMGGFNPRRSDIDILVVASKELTVETNMQLARMILHVSNNPFPIEISIITEQSLHEWKHPCPYEFHYSEDWRGQFEDAFASGNAITGLKGEDRDLAAHIMITNHHGIAVEGPAIAETFPNVPQPHYIDSILYDFNDCLRDIEDNPVYCVLNPVRVYWYLKEGVISSKYEAGSWGSKAFPKEISSTIQKAHNNYRGEKDENEFEQNELYAIRDYFNRKVEEINCNN